VSTPAHGKLALDAPCRAGVSARRRFEEQLREVATLAARLSMLLILLDSISVVSISAAARDFRSSDCCAVTGCAV
jgi:hypothetical protein